jgi:hypothetical protein
MIWRGALLSGFISVTDGIDAGGALDRRATSRSAPTKA